MTITRGDTHNFTVTVKDSSREIFDLTGYEMKFTAKKDLLSLDIDANISSVATIADPASGVGTFNLTPEQTSIDIGIYFYDVQISDGANNVYTVIKTSKLTIAAEVTKLP